MKSQFGDWEVLAECQKCEGLPQCCCTLGPTRIPNGRMLREDEPGVDELISRKWKYRQLKEGFATLKESER